MAEQIGIKLNGGPPELDGWSNVYEFEGWPPPERLAAFEVSPKPGVVAVAPADRVPEHHRDTVTFYRKIHQSKLADDDELLTSGIMVRGAEYEVEP